MQIAGYNYEVVKKELFTDSGQRQFIAIRDNAKRLLKQAGAFRMSEVTSGVSGSSFEQAACIDRMVELGEIVELKRNCWGQYRVFTTSKVHNY